MADFKTIIECRVRITKLRCSPSKAVGSINFFGRGYNLLLKTLNEGLRLLLNSISGMAIILLPIPQAETPL